MLLEDIRQANDIKKIRKEDLGVLAQDPRPRYQKDPDRVYGFGFAGLEVRFSVADGVLTVWEIMEDL